MSESHPERTETETATTTTLPDPVRNALNLAGAWSDLDWEETVEALDRIRHESQPTPPIEPAKL